MRVIIDSSAQLAGTTGVARYAHELTRALPSAGADVVRVAIGRAIAPVPPGVRHVPVPLRVARAWWSVVSWPPIERLAGRADLVHVLDMAPPPTRLPLVMTIHDLVALERPDLHHPRTVAQQYDQLAAAHRAAGVIADSQATADALIARGIPARRITVAPLGLTEHRATGPPEPDGATVLAVGGLERRKGFDVLLRALARPELVDARAVVVGPDHGQAAELRALAAELRIPDRVHFPGRVDDAALWRLYRDATVLCAPSHAEGFGLPILEAMGAGLPVVATDLPVFRELTDGAAVLVPVDDPAALATAIERLLVDPVARADAARAGHERAAGFTWAATAAATVAAYERVLD